MHLSAIHRNSSKVLLLLLPLLLLWSFSGCKEYKKRRAARLLQDSTVYALQNYSEQVIDSNFLHQFIDGDKSLDSFREPVIDFYRRRGFHAAWFSNNRLSSQAVNFLAVIRNYVAEYGDSTKTGNQLSTLADSLEALTDSGNLPIPLTDVLFTTAFFKYAQTEFYGSDKSPHDLEWYIPRKKKDYLRLLNKLITSDTAYALYEPQISYYTGLKASLIKYRNIEKRGGFPVIAGNATGLKEGDSTETVQILKQYLRLTGDLASSDTTQLFTGELTGALKRFQQRMGIPATGQLQKLTLTALNVPVQQRIRQIMINLERLRWAPDSIPADYLLVNIPEFTLHVFERGLPVWKMNVVVGKQISSTSIFSGKLSQVVFSPYWNVPQSIIMHELLPYIKRNPGYLNAKNMEVVSNGTVISPYSVKWGKYKKGVPFTIREKPGVNNSLGLIKFLFPNQYDIYMHDTPAKYLFEQNNRAFSHGCIRLADAEKLANYIFRNDTSVSPEKINEWMNSGIEKTLPVKPGIPVFIAYFTSWVSLDGSLNFRNDIYGLDEKLASEIFIE